MGFLLQFQKKMSSKSDLELICDFKFSDDLEAFEEICHRYCHLIFGICQKYLRNEEDSKDAVLEIIEKMISDLRHHDITNLKGWLCTVTRNHCLMKHRKTKKMSFVEKNVDEFQDDLVEFDENTTLNSDEEILTEELCKSLDQLKDGQRECIQLFYLERKSYREIAEITGLEIKQVKSNIQNGKRNLRNLMQK